MVIHLGDPTVNRPRPQAPRHRVRGRSLSASSSSTGFLRSAETMVVDQETGELQTLWNLNGEETRSGIFVMMPNEDPDYGGF